VAVAIAVAIVVMAVAIVVMAVIVAVNVSVTIEAFTQLKKKNTEVNFQITTINVLNIRGVF
jgi:polyisoprenoid-binding protein YceI